jgi:rfaE bifunctional protein nucleotidyltransferase chain/domain
MTNIQKIKNKIVSIEKATELINDWKINELKVVFTNGCFDILHKGHVIYLAQAADLGNRLIVGLNSDLSVKKQNKDSNRPINNQMARATVLASLYFVDLIVIFDEDTPYEIIKTFIPDCIVKGSDYNSQERDKKSKQYIVGADLMDKHGGSVHSIPFIDGYSTTTIINKIKN